jgi:hypothetical protein
MLGRNGTIGDATRFQGDVDYEFEYFGERNSEQHELTYHAYFADISPNNRSTDPIWVRYKSSPHFVFKFSDGNVLPILGTGTPSTTSTYNTVWGEETINTPEYLDIEPVTTAATD